MPQTLTNRDRLYAARRYTRRLATSHYENFTVVSMALPRRLWQDFYTIYAWCRHADDLADEITDPSQSLQALDAFRRDMLTIYTGGRPSHPINIALAETAHKFSIPPEPFLKLIDAFEQDQRVQRYDTWDQLIHYCTRSADPVGHLVLYLGGYGDADRQRLADFTCTALQLTNHWQDVSRDLPTGRLYIPYDQMDLFGVKEEDILNRNFTPAFRVMMQSLVQRTRALFAHGRDLLPLVDSHLRTDIELFSAGGEAILDRIEAVGYNVLAQRPVLSKWNKLTLLGRVLRKGWM